MKNTQLHNMEIKIENIQYHVEVIGNGLPVICLHGFSESCATWKELFIQGYKIYKIDLIGHGNSDKPKEQEYYSVETMINHIHCIINKLVKTKYSLIGYSMGGRIAVRYALSYVNEIEKLILESCSFGIKDEKEKSMRYLSDKLLAENIINKGISWFQQYWSSLKIFETQKKLPKEIKERINNGRLHNSGIALANTLMGSGQGVFPYCGEQIEKSQLPILYICGSLDKKYSELGREYLKRISNMRYVQVDDAGHNVHLEKPKEFQCIIESFLKK